MSSEKSKRIAVNTIVLYFRMIITTLVSLYTARLTLKILGVEDYGIYNVVGGIIGFMSIITSTMSSASQRFLSFDLGKHDNERFHHTYSMMVNLFVLYAILGVLLLEIVGPFSISRYLVIPSDRLVSAQAVFQFSLITFVANVINIPQFASIMAHERMGVYAYFTFADVLLKLLIVYTLYISPIDKLITLSAMTALSTIIITLITFLYCRKSISGCRYSFVWDKQMFSELSTYAGWNLFGSTSQVLIVHGQSIILNLFFGPIVNAAKAIADRVNSIVSSFSSNFFVAVAPQITKSYAEGDIAYMKMLVMRSSRFAFFLLLCIILPLIVNMKALLSIWLGAEQISMEMVRFCQLILLYTLICSLEAPITYAIRATGDIKRYQIYVGIQTLMFIPVCVILFWLGWPPYTSMVALCVIYSLVQITRIHMVRPVIEITYKEYVSEVALRVFAVTALSFLLSLLYVRFINGSIANTLLIMFACLITTVSCIFILGVNKKEKALIINLVKKYINR